MTVTRADADRLTAAAVADMEATAGPGTPDQESLSLLVFTSEAGARAMAANREAAGTAA